MAKDGRENTDNKHKRWRCRNPLTNTCTKSSPSAEELTHSSIRRHPRAATAELTPRSAGFHVHRIQSISRADLVRREPLIFRPCRPPVHPFYTPTARGHQPGSTWWCTLLRERRPPTPISAPNINPKLPYLPTPVPSHICLLPPNPCIQPPNEEGNRGTGWRRWSCPPCRSCRWRRSCSRPP